ncbi:MAG: helix-turn-helix transcriptional regulator [Geobacter sp.]|nr:helix-turn-helix transcriptional regulator [Geobacter sp.]
MNLGNAVKEARKQAGKTLREVSGLCGLSIGFLSDIEHGRKNTSREYLDKIEGVLGLKKGALVAAADQDNSTKVRFRELFETRPQASMALLRLAEDLTDEQLEKLINDHLGRR